MTPSFNFDQVLIEWDVVKEQQKADFLEHMYKCDCRYNPTHPMHGLYTGLWHKFCIQEAGPVLRDQYFELLEAVRLYEQDKLQAMQPGEMSIVS